MLLFAAPLPQLTANKAIPSRISNSTSFARRFLPASPPTTTIPNAIGKNEAKIGRDPCLSSPTLGGVTVTFPPIVTVTVAVLGDVPSMANEVGDAAQLA